ncbi:hypothetical protein DSO57_1007871 [Entomophthora muscae]|uniref:Uncharacterized protein n=1 Tax=Entomophthora muscae TaxID=34485 RepID=A0ACC2TV18_9FUNG|nr:hypothetical protein DSO57_1007871 [Entomophthora muscae]
MAPPHNATAVFFNYYYVAIPVILIILLFAYGLSRDYISDEDSLQPTSTYAIPVPENMDYDTIHLFNQVVKDNHTLLFLRSSAIQSNLPVPLDSPIFFQITLLQFPQNARLVLGIAPLNESIDPIQVYGEGSISIEAIHEQPKESPLVNQLTFVKGDVFGCYINFRFTPTICFFKNGVASSCLSLPRYLKRVYPSVYATQGCCLLYSFDSPTLSQHLPSEENNV